MRIGVKSTLFRKIAAINTRYKVTAVMLVLVLGGLGLFALIGNTSASTPSNSSVSVSRGADTYYYGECVGYDGCSSNGKWKTTIYEVTSSAGTFQATCAEPNLLNPKENGTAVVLDNTSSDNKTITRILLLTGNYSSSIASAFNSANPGFWSSIDQDTSRLTTSTPFVIGHIMIGKLYSGQYWFAWDASGTLNSAMGTINSWFDTNYPYEHLHWKLYASGSQGDDNYQNVVWIESNPRNVYLNIHKTDESTGASLSGAVFDFIKYEVNGTRATIASSLTTGSDGKLSARTVDLGDNVDRYCFKETQAPEGYVGDTKEYCVRHSELPSEGNTKTLGITNQATPPPSNATIMVYKKDAALAAGNWKSQGGAKLLGTRIVVKAVNNCTSKTVITDTSDPYYYYRNWGVKWHNSTTNAVKFGSNNDTSIDPTTGQGGVILVDGSYIIYELPDPDDPSMALGNNKTKTGYKYSNEDEVKCVTPTDGNRDLEVTLENEVMKGGFELTKVKKVGDDATMPFPNVKFHIEGIDTCEDNGCVLKEYDKKTDSNGRISVAANSSDALPYGHYRITEVCDSVNSEYGCSYSEEFAIERDGQIVSLNGGSPIVNQASSPAIETVARNCTSSADNPSKVLPMSSSACVADAIALSHFIDGTKYKVTGSLMEVGNDTPLKTAEATWTQSSGLASKELKFSGIDTSDKEGATFYVMVDVFMYDNGNWISLGRYNENNSERSERVTVQTINRGGFKLVKYKQVGASIVPFSGVKFELTRRGSSDVLETYETQNGVIETANNALEAGQYTITEVCDATVAAYDCDFSENFEIVNDGQMVLINNGEEIVNRPKTPSIKTWARNCDSTASTPSSQIPISSEACVLDQIHLTNYAAGVEYRVVGTLKVQGSDTVLGTAESEAWIQTAGVKDSQMMFENIDTSNYANKTLYITSTIQMKDGSSWVDLKTFNSDGDDPDEEVTVSNFTISTVATGASGSVDSQGNILAGDVTVEDTVTVSGLTQGATYKIQGYIADGNGNRVTLANGDTDKTIDYTMNNSTGSEVSITMEFKFDASHYTGETLTVYEKVLDSAGNTIIAHNGGSTQQVRVVNPEIATRAYNHDVPGSKTVNIGNVKVIDYVDYTGLVPGETYILQASIYKKGSYSTPVSTAQTTFVPVDSNGTTAENESPVFEFSTTQMSPGDVLVVHEELYYGSVWLAQHKANNDSDQQVSISPIQMGTSASSLANPDIKQFNVGGTAMIHDDVAITGLVSGTTYKVKGWIVDATNGAEVTLENGDDGGNTITKGCTGITGETVVLGIDFKIDTVKYIGKRLTVYEQLLDEGGHVIARYELLADRNQTITVKEASIGTTAVRKGTNSHELGVGDMEIRDTINYENLVPGESYTLTGKVMKVADDGSVSILKINGTEVSSTKTVTAARDTGSWTMDFAINTVDIQGADLVVYEYLEYDGTEIAKHEDARVTTDNTQYIKVKNVDIQKLAKDGLETGSDQDDIIEPEVSQKIVDTVSYSGLEPGATYTLTGVVMRKDTGTELEIDGYPVTGRTEFTANSAGQGTTEVTFTLDATELPGVELVVFEKLFIGTDTTKPEIAKHEEITDQNQYIKVRPRIGTIAADAYDSDQMVGVGDVVIIDRVRYEGLIEGKSYIMIGTLMDKETGEPVSSVARCKEEPDEGEDEDEDGDGEQGEGEDEGGEDDEGGEGTPETDEDGEAELCLNVQRKVQSSVEFTVEDEDTPETDGVVEMTFSLNTRDLAGRQLVVFEEVYEADGYEEGESEPVTEHKDLEDASQTVGVYVPEIRTIATDKSDDDKELNYSGIVTLTDKVQYSGLAAGTDYILRGKVMNKETGQPIMLAGGTIEVETMVTAKGESGYFTMDFEFRTDSIAGKDLVVFEYLYIENIEIDAETDEALIWEKEVARHEDLGDESQTVHVKELPPDTGRITQEGGSAVVVSVLSFVGVVTVGFTIVGKRFWHPGGRHRLFEANQYGKNNWKRW